MLSYTFELGEFKLEVSSNMRRLIQTYGHDNELDVSMLPLVFCGNNITACRLEPEDDGIAYKILIDTLSDNGTAATEYFESFDLMTMINIYEWTYIYLLFTIYNIDYLRQPDKNSRDAVSGPLHDLYAKSIGMQAAFNISTDIDAMEELEEFFDQYQKYQVNCKQVSLAAKKILEGGHYPDIDNLCVVMEIVKHNKKICISAKTTAPIGKHIIVPVNKLDVLQMIYYYHIIFQNKNNGKNTACSVLF